MYLRRNEIVHPTLLEQYAREFAKNENPPPLPITQTDLWKFWCVTNGGKGLPDLSDVGRTYIECTPWEKGKAPGPSKIGESSQQPFSYVLVAGGFCPAENTKSYLSYWPSYSSGMSNDTFEAMVKIHYLVFVKHGIDRAIFRSVNLLEDFWGQFYGYNDFLGAESYYQVRVPAVILTNGILRYPQTEEGKCPRIYRAYPRLLEIGRETGIPVELT
jgi:hypothetical protein